MLSVFCGQTGRVCGVCSLGRPACVLSVFLLCRELQRQLFSGVPSEGIWYVFSLLSEKRSSEALRILPGSQMDSSKGV